MQKSHVLTITVLCILLLVFGVTQSLLVMANPQINDEDPGPDSLTKPPSIKVTEPANNSLNANDEIKINCVVSVGESLTNVKYSRLTDVYYVVDWQPNETVIYRNYAIYGKDPIENIKTVPFSCTLRNVPQGTHNLTISALEWGSFINGNSLRSVTSVFFTVDTIAPSIQIKSIENRTYTSTDIPLSITTDDPAAELSYVLDNNRVAIQGNTTLTGLTYGSHNLTVYARDKAGNTGSSGIIFTINESSDNFLTYSIVVVVASLIAMVCIAAVWYIKKSKSHNSMQNP